MSGGNRAKMKKGLATLTDLRLTADEPGIYLISIASATRKVCMQYSRRQ